MREIISLYNPHTSETDLGRIKFLSHSGLLAECILWTRRVHVKIHDSSAIYASTRRVYILTRRVAHSSYFWAEDLMTFDMGIGSILWRSFSEHFQEFFPYIWSFYKDCTTRDFDTQDMDELFPCLKSIEVGAKMKVTNLSTAIPGEFVPIPSLFSFYVFIMHNMQWGHCIK